MPEQLADALLFQRVSLSFDGRRVLENVSFRLERGETNVIMGASGSGKSVLLKLAMGLIPADSGEIFVLGEKITGRREVELFPVRQRIGMVFQEGALFDSLTVGENVGYVFERMPEVAPSEVARRVREALRFVELEQTIDQYPSELSGGMRRRVAIARALVGEPDILLYDSPTAGLDPITAQRIIALIIKQRDVRRVSSLLVTHRLQDGIQIARFCYDRQRDTLVPAGSDPSFKTHTRFLVLRDGEIAFHGRLEELVAREDPYLRKFLV